MTSDPSLDFYGPRLKTKRAKYHINQLELIFDRHVREDMKRMRRKGKRNRGEAPVTGAGMAFPEHVPTILGDAIHNLRAALDHAYCLLVKYNSGVINDRTRFYFCEDKQSLIGTINGQKPETLPTRGIIDFIVENIQPYSGGKLGLYELHRLDVTDKHLVLIPTTRVMRIDRLDFTDAKGRPTGSHLSGFSIELPYQSNTGFVSNPYGSLKLQGDPKATFDILFGGDQPFAGESVLQKLNTLFKNVSATLDALEREAR